jgi:UDP-N-acetylglucosamine/UDP-N-acetylgalactosamine diphosphorylase
MEDRKASLEKRLAAIGQEHAFRWWPELTGQQRARLLDQVESLDANLLARLIRLGESSAPSGPTGPLVPPPYVPLPKPGLVDSAHSAAVKRGEDALRAGEVAVITVAGGQGTRLGFDKPKGMYQIGAISHKTLFQIHAEKLLALERTYGRRVPWAIMLSDATDVATREYLAEKRYFGLSSEQVHYFVQGMLPALDSQRRLILTSKGSVFLSPNGHGGCLRALCDIGVLDKLMTSGVKHLFYFQVDNPAVTVCDPAFLGRHILASSELSLKVMSRRDAEEKIGVMVMTSSSGDPSTANRTWVVEYSDLPKDLKYACDQTGRLKFLMGSPAIHIFDTAFVARIGHGESPLPYHVAKKKVPFLDERGEVVDPKEPNSLKFEMFVFDALPLARNPTLVEMDRAEEFAPLKNATGEDSAESCRMILSEKWARWLESAGVCVPRDGNGRARPLIEISPCYALTPEQLAQKLPKGFRITSDKLHLES